MIMRAFLFIFLLLITPVAANARQGDVALYRDVATEVAGGAGYYETVANLHRERNYPLKPFVTVRPPAHAYLAAAVGPTGLIIIAWILAFLCFGAWHRSLQSYNPTERVSFILFLSAGASAFITKNGVFVHELISGLLVTLSLGLSWNRRLQIISATCAVFFRELAAPLFLILLYPFSLRQTFRVASAILLTAIYYIWHIVNVSLFVRPDDFHSQGWFANRGISALSDNFSKFINIEVPIWLSFAPLLGWIFYKTLLSFLWCTYIILLICIFGREDNYAWTLMLMPLYWAGLVFLFTPLSRTIKRSLKLDPRTLGSG